MAKKAKILMKKVVSSNIDRMGYDPASETCHIEFNTGATYEYKPFPREMWVAMNVAKSIGGFFALHIKNSKLINCTKL